MTAVRGAVGVFGELLMTAGALMILFVVWQLWWTDVVAEVQQDQLTAELRQEWGADSHERQPAGAGALAAPEDPVTPEQPEPVSPEEPGASGPAGGDVPVVPVAEAGAAFAVVHVPRFGDSYEPRVVLEGTGEEVLERGVGHYRETVMPGAVGNFAVAGHRVTYGKPFNQIAELREGDAVVVETESTWFTYRVTGHLVVSPQQVDVVAPAPGRPGAAPTERLMTLTTCHPMFSARQRYVVRAELESWQPAAEGDPTSLTLAQG